MREEVSLPTAIFTLECLASPDTIRLLFLSTKVTYTLTYAHKGAKSDISTSNRFCKILSIPRLSAKYKLSQTLITQNALKRTIQARALAPAALLPEAVEDPYQPEAVV
jgi:hypothetical protein